MNLIDGEIGSEPRVNNAPVVVNEVDINQLNIPTEEEVSKQLDFECRMNKGISLGVKEISYKCPNCPNEMKHLCLYCLENCHKSHINGLLPDLFKGELIDFQKNPCECGVLNHRTSIKEEKIIQGSEKKVNCPFNKLFSLIKPKYVYRRKDNNQIYCLYCINNFSLPVVEEEEDNNSSSAKGSKASALGTLSKRSNQGEEYEDKRSSEEKENVSDDKDFYEKYEKILVDYSKPFPQCECVNDLHKHQIVTENIDNLWIYMSNIVEKNKINLDKLSYQIFNSDVFNEVLLSKMFQTHETIYNAIKDIEDLDASKMGGLGDDSNFTEIELDEKTDWELYNKATKLLEISAKRLKIFNFFGISWINENYKKYFSFETLSKLLQCKSNIESSFFKLQLFTTKIYRQSRFNNIPHIFLNNENMTFINRLLFASSGTSKSESIFEEGNKIVEKIFYLLDSLSDNQSVDPKDYNGLFIEGLKILKTIIPYKANDITCVMNLFRKIENNLGNVKEKKEKQNKVAQNLEKIIEKIFTYFNDNKFIFKIKESEVATKYDYSFLSSSEYNKELISTLFNFKGIEINGANPLISGENFYDSLLSERDSFSETIEDFLNSDENWLRKINKDYNYIFHGAGKNEPEKDVEEFYNTVVLNIQRLLTNNMNEFQFLSIINQSLNRIVKYLKGRPNDFKQQASFFQNKYYVKLIFLICIQERILKFEMNTEVEDSEEGKKITALRKEIFRNFTEILTIVTKDNPLAGSILFSRIAISLLINGDFNDLNLYIELLKMLKKYKCKINTYFLTSHVHHIFNKRMKVDEENIGNLIILLNLYKLILKISSQKSLLSVNNIIATDLKSIIEDQEFKNVCDNMSTKPKINVVGLTYKCINLLQNEYFYIINKYIDIKKIIEMLNDDKLNLRIRIIFTQIHTNYFIKNYFSTITIQKFFQYENLISSNLVENLSSTTQQKELQDYLFGTEKTSQLSDEGNEKMTKILFIIFETLSKYRCYYLRFYPYFQNNFKLTVSFFKNSILLPTAYSVYKLTYFAKSYNAALKYNLFKLIYLYLQCVQYFLNEVVPKFNLEDENNAKIWSKLLKEDADIEEIKKNMSKSIGALGIKSEKILNITILFDHFVQNSKCFRVINDIFLRKEEESEEKKEEESEEDEDDDKEFTVSFYNLCLDMNLFKRMKIALKHYQELKKEFEGNNIFDDIFQDDNLEGVQKTICLDLLHKLYYKKEKRLFNKQEHVGYIFQSDIMRGPQEIDSNDDEGKDKENNLGDFYNPYISTFLEEKSLYYEIVDKCFKSNPSVWQEIFVDNAENGKELIYNIIMKQLPFLLQFIYIEFNKIDTREIKYYEYFVNVLEFLRLLCEDHNPLFQTMFINYEKAIGTISVIENSKDIFMPFISKIPIFVLSNVKYINSKKSILDFFNQKKLEYFYPLIDKITDFLIEVIQGTYPENFNDITNSKDEVGFFGIVENIKAHNRFLDYLYTDSSYEYFIKSFFQFFNCFVEDAANPLAIKVPIMNIFQPKILLNISLNAFKNCIYKYVGKTIKKGCSDEFIQIYINDYDNIIEDTSFSLFITIFIYIKRANSLKDKLLGDKYKEIIDALKELADSEEEFEENSNFLLRREYYKFCWSLTKETEILYTENKSKDDKELFKYRKFFAPNYMREVIEFRNKSCSKIQNFEKVFFLVHPDSLYIKDSDIDLFLQKATYENFNTKLSCLLDYYSELNQLIEMRKTLSKKMLVLGQINYLKMKTINAIWAVVTNLCFALGKGEDILFYIMMCSAYSHIGFLSLLSLNWFIFQCIKKSKVKNFHFSITFLFKMIMTLFTDAEIFPFIWTLFFGLLAIIGEKTHFLFSLQLFPIFLLFDMMRNVLDAVKARYNQFLATGFLMTIFIIFCSGITFYFFNYNGDGEKLCTSYLNCFIYLFNYGIRSGGLPFGIKILGQEGFWGEFIFNWAFFFVLILVIMNIAGGIIVDKFHELREKSDQLYEEKKNVCYICSLHRSNFEIKGINFEYHQHYEHNIENYFHYLMKINRTDEHDLNSVDFQVYNAFEQKKIVFFPIKRAKSLEKA